MDAQQPGSGAPIRSLYVKYITEAKLSKDNVGILENVAVDFDAEIEQLNRQMRHIIGDFRAKNMSNGQVVTNDGKLPDDSKEVAQLDELGKQKDELSQKAYEQLSEAMGAQAFAQFDDYVQAEVVPNITVNNVLSSPAFAERVAPQPAMQRKAGEPGGGE